LSAAPVSELLSMSYATFKNKYLSGFIESRNNLITNMMAKHARYWYEGNSISSITEPYKEYYLNFITYE
jgi:hypothetical protein